MKYTVIIATSQNRTDWLIKRSLNSVYGQVAIDRTEWNVLIVDDNENEKEFVKIQRRIEELRADLLLKPTEFRTSVLKNKRTRYMSGTGAWNTGIFEAHKQFPNGFVSILDDDDAYLPHHLAHCKSALKEGTVAAFQRLIWQNEDGSTMHVDLTKDQLTTENFFIGNPGVQGSNMFFKTASLVDIGGFDENLPNTTDRDLMIRFLGRNNLNNIEVLQDIGVIHHNHKKQKVNNDRQKKGQGLDIFYRKYKAQFSEEAYHKSLSRAKAFFGYRPKEEIIICMPMRNAERTVEKSILSVLEQKNTHREIILLVGNDGSTDNSESIVQNIAKHNPSVVLLNVNFGSAYLTRNHLNEYARRNYPNCVLIGRLDADDVLHTRETLSEVEKRYDERNFDVLICGNKQVRNGGVLEWENRPSSKLLDDDYLLNQLFEMTQGNPKAELPSCNTFIKPTVKAVYPNKASAEDHWFTVRLLAQKDKLNILIDESLIYCYYSLDGMVTSMNKKSEKYLDSRVELYQHFQKRL